MLEVTKVITRRSILKEIFKLGNADRCFSSHSQLMVLVTATASPLGARREVWAVPWSSVTK